MSDQTILGKTCAWCGEPATTTIELEPERFGMVKDGFGGSRKALVRQAVRADVCPEHANVRDRVGGVTIRGARRAARPAQRHGASSMSTTTPAFALTVPELARMLREAERLDPPERIWLYAIQHGDGGPIKIGLTKSPRKRLAALQIGNPVTLNGIAAWRCYREDEAILHDDFHHVRLRGEWFWPDPALVEYVLYQGGDYEDWE